MWDCAKNKPFRKLNSLELISTRTPADFPGMHNVSESIQEWEYQRTSFGPMQVMGAVAREQGFTGDLSTLSHELGIECGVKHLKNLYRRFYNVEGMEGVIEAYNRGRPYTSGTTSYAQKVMVAVAQYHKQGGL
jgi:hypothetical protein